MSTPVSSSLSRSSGDALTTSTTASEGTKSALASGDGRISVAENVVTKIAGLATREVAGVHAMGTGAGRALGALKERIPGSSGPVANQGVSAEVGETQVALDLDVVIEYGVSIADLGRSVQRNVKNAVERMTGLEVTEVNVSVGDVFLGDQSEQDAPPPRVQ